MATKKLKVELELETAKAKRKAKELEVPSGGGSGGSGSGPSASAEKLSKSLDRAAASAKRLDTSSLAVVRAFTGIGVGLAANYAASHMKQGAARDAVEYGANAVSGAGMGMMAGKALGPHGAIIGALVGGAGGLLKTYLDKSGEKDKFTEDWKKSEHDYKDNKAFADFFRGLTDMSDKTKSFADRIAEAESELQKYKDVEKTLMDNIEKMISQGRYDDANAQRGYLDVNRQRQQQLEGALRSMKGKTGSGGVAYYSGTDSLAKVGGGNGKTPEPTADGGGVSASPGKVGGSFFFGNFGGSTTRMFGSLGAPDQMTKTANEQIARLEKEGNEILKMIAENTKKNGGSTWQ